jgi:hypothetical protein
MSPRFALVTIDRAEGNESVGTKWQQTFVIPMEMTVRDMAKALFGDDLDPKKMPHGTVSFTVPEFLPKGWPEKFADLDPQN